MLDHVGVAVSDFERSRVFYAQALAPLGIAVVMEVGPELTGGSAHAGFGREGKPFFWIGDGRRRKAAPMSPLPSRSGRRWTRSTARRWTPAAWTTVHRACARTTTRTTPAPSSSTRTDTPSRPYATGPTPLKPETACSPGS